jgi:predicted small integral membrane protein
MIVRLSKCALLLGVALYLSVVVLNNVTDYGSNYQYVRHVLSMDGTYPGNHGMWRAIVQPGMHTAFYVSIIAWEAVAAGLCWWGAGRMMGRLRSSRQEFQRAKTVAEGALTLGCLLWLVAFLTVGGEWFLMWQSKVWDGRESAGRLFMVFGLVLIYLSSPEAE